jgi:hypothetical protein
MTIAGGGILDVDRSSASSMMKIEGWSLAKFLHEDRNRDRK